MRQRPVPQALGKRAAFSRQPVPGIYVGILGLLVLVVFVQVVSFDFVNIDDNVYVTQNAKVQEGLHPANIQWAFTTTDYSGFWQPFVWISLMIDVELFGRWSGGFHLTNVVFHIANTVLLFFWLCELTGCPRRSFVVAAIFAAHPMHVESVAWVTERKDVLSTFFGLLALLSWQKFGQHHSRLHYCAAWLMMAASLMSKQMLVTLPFVMLLLDYWKARTQPQENNSGSSRRGTSTRRLIVEKLPFFALTVVFSMTAAYSQTKIGATTLLSDLSVADRLCNAIVAYRWYLQKFFVPFDLCVFYPYPEENLPLWSVVSSALLLTAITTAAWFQRKQRRHLLFGWLWFMGSLVPVIGIVQIGYQQYADRFSYFPYIGLTITACWMFPYERFNAATRALTTVIIAALAVMAWLQTATWKNSITLCQHGIAVTERNWYLHAMLGASIMTESHHAEHLQAGNTRLVDLSEEHLRTALAIEPSYATAHFNLALILSDTGRMNEAGEAFAQALALRPDYRKARILYCEYLRRVGDDKELQKQLLILQDQDG